MQLCHLLKLIQRELNKNFNSCLNYLLEVVQDWFKSILRIEAQEPYPLPSGRWGEIRHDPPNLDSFMYMTNMLVEMLKYKIFLNLKKYQPGRKQIAFEGQKT